jgi:hypothetical protein
MTLRGIDGNETVLIPNNQEPLLNKILEVADDRQERVLVPEIQKSLISIGHKLNIVRYNAGLIRDLSPEDYIRFRYRHLYSGIDSLSSNTSFKDRCLFTMTDIDEYRLFLTFFVETFAAASFSLFDVCGFLLRDLYQLSLDNRRVSFAAVMNESRIQSSSLYHFVLNYLPNQTNSVPWIGPLKDIRNETTHRPITRVCRLPPDSEEGNLYSPVELKEFILYRDFFPSRTDEVRLSDFVEECFDGLEEFVEELYDSLRQAVDDTGRLPIY